MTTSREEGTSPESGIDDAELARTMVHLADTLVDDFDVLDLLNELAKRCVELLGVAASGLMLLGAEGELEVVASSDETAQMLELLQLQSSDGPCMESYRTGVRVDAPDVRADETRWPAFSKAAALAGFHSVHAFPMHHRETVVGALNLFCDQPGGLPAQGEVVAQALADLATIGVLHHQAMSEAQLLNEQLQRALDSRIVIEQAKGIVAERSRIDVDTAFERLRLYARNRNQRLANVASEVIAGRLEP